MASLFTSPLQALLGQDNNANSSPLSAMELARNNTPEKLLPVDANWVFVDADSIQGVNWNKSYPYQLMIVDRAGKPQSTFTLPIPPQDLQISTPFAINTVVTLGGIIEEHNGAPLRNISFSGTTGVVPLKGTGAILKQANALQGIFAGTVNALGNLQTNAKTLVGAPTDTSNLVGTDDATLKGTGYYQFRLLQRFLESYVFQKKGNGGGDLRLALAMWKDQAVYLVTPVSFELRRSAQSPWEYTYSLQFKGWRRVNNLGGDRPQASAFTPVTRDPNAFAQLLNKVQDSRRVLQSFSGTLKALRADVQNLILEPMRQLTLFCKDYLGVNATAADISASIVPDLKGPVLASAAALAALGQEAVALAVKSGKSTTGSGQSVHGADSLSGSSEINKIFDNPGDNFEAMEKIKPAELDLPPVTVKKLIEERRRIRAMTRFDFETIRDQFVEFQAAFADAVGAGSTSYDRIYNRTSVSTTKTPTLDDFDVLFALNQTIMELNRLAASSETGQQSLTTVESVAGMASASGIAFTTPVSKFAVPFPYGSTLEQLSAQYLGTPDRWHEIVALNGLRQPYVDEEGFDLPLLVNGSGNQVVVGDASNLYNGQSVWLSSTNTARTKRRIVKIERISPVSNILTLDGDPDLDRFSTLATATLHAFLPDTVNSQMLIYIPSPETADESFNTKSIPGVNEFDPLISAGGVDLLLTQSGDLAVTPDGDCRLAIGLTNLIQRLRTAIGTPKGSLLHHPEYGLGIQVGSSTADLDAKQMLASLQEMVRGDSAFTGVSGVAISKAGPLLRVAMSVGISGTNQTIPLTVDIRQ